MKTDEKLEGLDNTANYNEKNDFNNENLRTINTSEIASEQVETIAVDSHGRVDAISLDYNDYRSDLTKIYKTTSMENSIISTFVIENSNCNHSITIRDTSGINTTKKTNSFQYNDSFIDNFLIPMIRDYSKNNTIFNSTIEILDEDKSNLIIRTSSNDSLILIGITIELANQIKDLVTADHDSVTILEKSAKNERGIGNSLAITLAMLGMIIVIIGVIAITMMTNK